MNPLEPDAEPDIKVSKPCERRSSLSRVLSMVLTLAELFRVSQIPQLVILLLASIAKLLIITSMIALSLVTGS